MVAKAKQKRQKRERDKKQKRKVVSNSSAVLAKVAAHAQTDF